MAGLIEAARFMTCRIRGGSQVHDPRHGHCGADGAPGAMRVDVGPSRCGAAYTRQYLVAGHETLGQLGAAKSHVLGNGQRPGEDVDGGVAATKPCAFIHLQRDAGSGVGEGGHHWLRF